MINYKGTYKDIKYTKLRKHQKLIELTSHNGYAGYTFHSCGINKEWNDKNDWKRYNKDNAVIIGLVICYFAINYVWIVLLNDTLKYDYNLIDLLNQ